ncbi:flavodoxin family protein [Glaciimonas sp. CA11.2]|uniref:flavodoxin family protein n=1 Tax=Glaciimonas sp. CA11.2 TaxID=3048601 RepID=UPI002AB59E43|nr:flavodoxin family protein [Glaciimonas sp. CA11.2]MDY7545614.1 flavodoxin family protein [Glaciimonas sp. CA11.2]MEB0164030.1 flavodoxin family protein [Glaciimonas sp. CA11.2]
MSISSSELKGVVVFHSGYGHTKRVADAIAEGANASLLQIDAEGNLSDQAWADINEAHYIILGSPTYMGGPSWQFKKFADASSKPWFADLWQDKVFGGFTNSASINGDKLATLQYFTLLAAQHRGIWVGMGMKSSNTKASQRDDINRMGSFLGPMAQTPADASPEEMSSGDLETARLYGLRVAEIAAKLFSIDPQGGSLNSL